MTTRAAGSDEGREDVAPVEPEAQGSAGAGASHPAPATAAPRIVEQIQARYGEVAGSSLSSASPGVAAIAEAFGYRPEELLSLPAAANMGLSCGNPLATANLPPG